MLTKTSVITGRMRWRPRSPRAAKGFAPKNDQYSALPKIGTVRASHMRAVLSVAAVTMRVPSGLYAALDRGILSAQYGDERAGMRVPDACGPIVRCGDNARAIGTVGHAIDCVVVSTQDGDLWAGVRIPDARCLVTGCGYDVRAITTVRSVLYDVVVPA